MITKSFEKFNNLLDNIIYDFPGFEKCSIQPYDNSSFKFKGLLVNDTHWYRMESKNWYSEIKKSRIYTPNYIYKYDKDGCDIKIILIWRQKDIIKDILE